MKIDLKKLEKLNKMIKKIAKKFCLDFFPQEFDIIPAQKMLEIMAYGFSVNFSHWSFGRDYEKYRTMYEYKVTPLPMEVVYNSNPCRAYLMKGNPLAVQLLTMAHVYAHNDFFKSNKRFQKIKRNVIPDLKLIEDKIRNYSQKYGLERVEELITAGMALWSNIDPDTILEREDRAERIKKMIADYAAQYRKENGRPSSVKEKQKLRESLENKSPLTPEKDFLLYIIKNATHLKEWERDILEIIRDESLYQLPVKKTKIMNEGWAALWHKRIMQELYRQGKISSADWETFCRYHSRVLASSKNKLNPYLMGTTIWEDIERKQGKEKMFQIRKDYTDYLFVKEFLTQEIIDQLEYYIYQEVPKPDGSKELIIVETDAEKIRDRLVATLAYQGPSIKIINGNLLNQGVLLLKHFHEGMDLDPEYRDKTLEHIYYIWKRPVILLSKETLDEKQGEKNVIHTYNGNEHERAEISEEMASKLAINKRP